MAEVYEKMSPADFLALARLLAKARYDESLNNSEDTKDTLINVQMWASRRV